MTYIILDSADSKFLIPLSFLADAPAACDAASGPVQCAGSQPGAFPSAMHGNFGQMVRHLLPTLFTWQDWAHAGHWV